MNIFFVWSLFEVKHYLADFVFQTEYMLRKFRPGWEFVLPLASHCAVHAVFTLGILLYFKPHLWYLCLAEFVIHFVMDRIKASPKLLGQFDALSKREWKAMQEHADCPGCANDKVSNKFFWFSLGFDQMIHNLTYLAIVYRMFH